MKWFSVVQKMPKVDKATSCVKVKDLHLIKLLISV